MSTQGSCMLVQLTESPASPAVWKCPVLALMEEEMGKKKQMSRNHT